MYIGPTVLPCYQTHSAWLSHMYMHAYTLKEGLRGRRDVPTKLNLFGSRHKMCFRGFQNFTLLGMYCFNDFFLPQFMHFQDLILGWSTLLHIYMLVD